MSESELSLTIGVGGIVIGLLGSYVLFRLGRKERRPVYAVTGNVVVRADEKRDIEVRHKDEPVPIVTRTVVAFWNAGREPIRGNDLVESHPLALVLDADVLEATVVAETRPEIDFDRHPQSWHRNGTWYEGVELQFSHLNHQDGGAVEILHTGQDPMAVTVEGAIVGVDGPPTRIPTPLWDDPAGIQLNFMVAILLLTFGFGLLAVEGTDQRVWFAGTIAAGVAALLNGIRARRKDRRRIPDSLREVLWPPATKPSGG